MLYAELTKEQRDRFTEIINSDLFLQLMPPDYMINLVKHIGEPKWATVADRLKAISLITPSTGAFLPVAEFAKQAQEALVAAIFEFGDKFVPPGSVDVTAKVREQVRGLFDKMSGFFSDPPKSTFDLGYRSSFLASMGERFHAEPKIDDTDAVLAEAKAVLAKAGTKDELSQEPAAPPVEHEPDNQQQNETTEKVTE